MNRNPAPAPGGDTRNGSHGLNGNRRAVITALGATVFSLLLVWTWLGALHSPSPRHVHVGVVAPAAVRTELQAGLDARAPGSFDLVGYGGAGQATAAVRIGDVSGALVIDQSASGPRLNLYTAGAGGPVLGSTLTEVFRGVAQAQHASFTTADLVPLPAADRMGSSGFFLVLATLIPGVIVGAILGLGAKTLSRARLLAVVAGFAVAIAGADVLMAVGTMGALAGHGPAVAGIAAALAFSVTLPIAAAARRLGSAVLPVSAYLLLGLGVPASGTPAGLGLFTPAFYHWIAPALPNSAAPIAIRDAVYFGGHGLAAPLVGLACWAAMGLVLLLIPAARGSRTESAVGAGADSGAPAATTA